MSFLMAFFLFRTCSVWFFHCFYDAFVGMAFMSGSMRLKGRETRRCRWAWGDCKWFQASNLWAKCKTGNNKGEKLQQEQHKMIKNWSMLNSIALWIYIWQRAKADRRGWISHSMHTHNSFVKFSRRSLGYSVSVQWISTSWVACFTLAVLP